MGGTREMMSFALLLLLSIVSSSKADGVLGDEEALSFREYGKNGIKLLYLNYKDQYTTLEDEPDRTLSTVVESSWKFNDGTAALYNGAMYTAVYNSAIRSIMDEFFGPAEEGKESTIIQETQRRAQVSVLCRNRALQFVEMAWPNKHYFPWDLDNFPTL